MSDWTNRNKSPGVQEVRCIFIWQLHHFKMFYSHSNFIDIFLLDITFARMEGGIHTLCPRMKACHNSLISVYTGSIRPNTFTIQLYQAIRGLMYIVLYKGLSDLMYSSVIWYYQAITDLMYSPVLDKGSNVMVMW